MGLLEKALQYYNLQVEKKTAGFLAGAALYSKSLESAETTGRVKAPLQETAIRAGGLQLDPGGLLAKAERFYLVGQREGIFAQAQRFGQAHVPRGMKVGKIGLLQKALRFAEELETAREEVILPEKEISREEIPVTPAVEPVKKRTRKAPVLEKIAAAPPEIEEPVEIPEWETLFPALEQLLEQQDTLGLLSRLTGIVGSEGYEAFCSIVLNTLMRLGKAKSGFLITAHRRGYREDTFVASGKALSGDSGKRRKKISYGKSSKLIRHLHENREAVIAVSAIKDTKLVEDCAALEPYEMWTIVPLALGEFLAGFFIIGNQPKRPGMNRDHLLTLTRVAAFHIVPHVIERNATDQVDKLSAERNELISMLELYNYSIMSRFSMSEILAHIAQKFEIGAAVIMTGWDSGGTPKLKASVGLSDKGTKRYRVTKSDRAIKRIIREGAPAVPEDLEKRLNSFLKEDREAVNTAVVVPIRFIGQTLGVLIVHRMKGVATRVTGHMKNVLLHIGQSLVPFLLYDRMINLEPFEVFESLLEREAARARKERSSLHVVAFRVKNFKAVIKEKGFDRYRKLLERFSNLIREKVGDRGLVHILSLNKVVFLLVMKEADEATYLVVEVKSAVTELLQKEKAKLPLSLQPFRTTYPNESRSVAEIIQLIE